jgi:hypothetical protein
MPKKKGQQKRRRKNASRGKRRSTADAKKKAPKNLATQKLNEINRLLPIVERAKEISKLERVQNMKLIKEERK